jgi:hypothetical protein
MYTHPSPTLNIDKKLYKERKKYQAGGYRVHGTTTSDSTSSLS